MCVSQSVNSAPRPARAAARGDVIMPAHSSLTNPTAETFAAFDRFVPERDVMKRVLSSFACVLLLLTLFGVAAAQRKPAAGAKPAAQTKKKTPARAGKQTDSRKR